MRRHGPIRVTFLFTTLEVGGAERIGCELVRRLDRIDFQPSVICLKHLGRFGLELSSTQTIHVAANLKRSRFDPFAGQRLASALRSLQPHVLCMFGSGGDRSFWGRLAAAWVGVPVRVCCPHAMGDYEPWEPYNRLLSSLTDCFVAISRRHRRYLVREAHLPASKVVVIENGVDTERFSPEQRRRTGGGCPVRVGLIAALRPEKNVEMLLRVAKRFRETQLPVQFVIVGDGPERARLQRIAKDWALEDNVQFVGFQQDTSEVYRTLDIVVLTSRFEVLPCSLMEAMASGLPVVATDVGAVADLVEDGRTGFLTPPDDVDTFSRRLEELVRDEQLRQRMGSEGRKRVEQRFTVERMTRRFEQLFRNLLDRRAASTG